MANEKPKKHGRIAPAVFFEISILQKRKILNPGVRSGIIPKITNHQKNEYSGLREHPVRVVRATRSVLREPPFPVVRATRIIELRTVVFCTNLL